MSKRIAFIKTAWCDYYNGDTPIGAHDYLVKNGFGHECFNMRPYKEKFFIYIPPMGSNESAPNPPMEDHDDWVIIHLAKHLGSGPLVIVGWYSGAKFLRKYRTRPEYGSSKNQIPKDPEGDPYVYTIEAREAVFIPPEYRSIRPPSNNIRRSPIYYAKGNPQSPASEDRRKMARFGEKLISGRILSPNLLLNVPKVTDGSFYADKEHRDKVEKASMLYASDFFSRKNYKVTDVSHQKGLGYDLLAQRNGEELHIEVKGTASKDEIFFITKNEDNISKIDTWWRLFIVSECLSSPKHKIYSGKEYNKEFKKQCMQFRCIKKH